jgi:hypothetical protein
MAYSTGSATDLADLLSDLNTFATANGWTVDEFDTVAGDWAIHKNTVYVSGRWDVSSPVALSLHQALGFISTATLPGNHTDDSGHGYKAGASHTNANLVTERHVSDLGPGPFLSYHFFENDASPAYIHVVAQTAAGVYKHFGFGELDKIGDWTGGEYCYGYYTDSAVNQTAIATDISILFDAVFLGAMANIGQRSATVHVEGLSGMTGAQKWGAVMGSRSAALTGDTDINGELLTRLLGGFRGGPVGSRWAHHDGSNFIGFAPMYPINLWHHEDSNGRVRLLGTLPDVRGISIRNFEDEEEVVIGSDTWIVFPSGRRTADNLAFRTYHQGIAYKKVTA